MDELLKTKGEIVHALELLVNEAEVGGAKQRARNIWKVINSIEEMLEEKEKPEEETIEA